MKPAGGWLSGKSDRAVDAELQATDDDALSGRRRIEHPIEPHVDADPVSGGNGDIFHFGQAAGQVADLHQHVGRTGFLAMDRVGQDGRRGEPAVRWPAYREEPKFGLAPYGR